MKLPKNCELEALLAASNMYCESIMKILGTCLAVQLDAINFKI